MCTERCHTSHSTCSNNSQETKETESICSLSLGPHSTEVHETLDEEQSQLSNLETNFENDNIAAQNDEAVAFSQHIDLIEHKYGKLTASAIKNAVNRKYPLLSTIAKATLEINLEEQIRKLENVIKRTIANYRALDFYAEYAVRHGSRTTRSMLALRLFEENDKIPCGYYTFGMYLYQEKTNLSYIFPLLNHFILCEQLLICFVECSAC